MQVLHLLVNSLQIDVAPIPGIPHDEIPKTMCPGGQETVKAGLAVDV